MKNKKIALVVGVLTYLVTSLSNIGTYGNYIFFEWWVLTFALVTYIATLLTLNN